MKHKRVDEYNAHESIEEKDCQFCHEIESECSCNWCEKCDFEIGYCDC